MAGTNAPWDVDPALRRPGRFSKLILVPPPDQESRKQIFKIQCKKKPVDTTVDFEDLAKRTDGYSSADISQICNEAADIPLSEAIAGTPPRKILQQDFYEVLKKRTSSITPWFRLAKASIEKSGEKDIFQDLFTYIEKYA
jgi:transitional endoplasmic reticulum ATPase